MSNQKYVGHDAVVYFRPLVGNPEWGAVFGSTDIINDLYSMKMVANQVTIENSVETIDVTPVGSRVKVFADNKRDYRVTINRRLLVDAANYLSKAVPYDIRVTLGWDDYARDSFRSPANAAATTWAWEGAARSIDITLSTETVRVDGVGDGAAVKRWTHVDCRARMSSLIPIATLGQSNLHILASFNPAKRVLIATINVLTIGTAHTIVLTGGVTRSTISYDNPMAQDIEMVCVGYGASTASGVQGSPNAVTIDPALELFKVESGNYNSLVFGTAIQVGNATIYGTFGAEEYTLSINENDVTSTITGTFYSESGIAAIIGT